MGKTSFRENEKGLIIRRRIALKKNICALIAIVSLLTFAGLAWSATTTDVAGTWNYSGNGTVNGYNATDVGTMTVTASGEVGKQTITQVSVSGKITNTSNGQSQSYSYSVSTALAYDGSFSTKYNGITITFTETSRTTAKLTEKGRTTDTGDSINFTYDVTKSTSSGGSSGGGCSVGAATSSVLLLLPLLLLGKIK